MKKVKIAFWVLLAALIALITFQNLEFLQKGYGFQLDLKVVDTLYAPVLPNGVYLVAFFVTGLLIAYFLSLFERFRSRKTIKLLKAEIETCRSDLAAVRQGSVQTGESAAAAPEGGGAEPSPAPAVQAPVEETAAEAK